MIVILNEQYDITVTVKEIYLKAKYQLEAYYLHL